MVDVENSWIFWKNQRKEAAFRDSFFPPK